MNTVSKKFRGRPRKSSDAREAGRGRLIEAAIALLNEGGSQHLTVRAVAERVGVSVGTVYGLFDHLEELKLEANAITTRALREHLTGAVPPETVDAETALLALAKAYIDFARANRRRWAALFDPVTIEAPSTLSAEIAGSFALIEAILARAGGDPDTVPVLAKALWSSVHGMVYLGELQGLGPVGPDDVPGMVGTLVRATVRGLEKSAQGDRA